MSLSSEEKKNCFIPQSSAKILWNFLSRTKIINSVRALKVEKGIQRKVSVRTTRTQKRAAKDGYVSSTRTSYQESTSSSKRKSNDGCYLCQIEYQPSIVCSTPEVHPSIQIRAPPASRPCAVLVKARDQITHLPITRSQPPCLPRRSTSLHYHKISKRLDHLQQNDCPRYALTNTSSRASCFSDGRVFQYLVYLICGPKDSHANSQIFKNETWKLILQAVTHHPAIHHLLFIIGSLLYHDAAISPPSVSSQLTPVFIKHHNLAASHLNYLFSGSKERILDPQTYDIALMALYLLSYIHHLSDNIEKARHCQRIACKLVKRVTRIFGSGNQREREGLPGCTDLIVEALKKLGLQGREERVWFMRAKGIE